MMLGLSPETFTLLHTIISLVGIFGVINPAYQKNAVWKK